MISDAQSNFGSWSLKLRSSNAYDEQGRLLPAAPQELLDLFAVTDGPDAFLGHIIVTSQAFDPAEVDVLALSRYTGVLRESKFSSTEVEINGSGLVYWLGDLQERGPVFRTELSLEGESFADGIAAILPPAIAPGTIVPEAGTASANYLYVTARAALENWLSLFGAEYYITPQGELNAGTPASLFPSYNNPTTFVIRKGAGADMNLKPLPLSSATMSGDMTNFATRVVSLVQVEETSFIEGQAEESTAKRDLHGNLVDITDINNETTTLAANADARAAARLAQIGVPRTSVELSTENYDIHGDFKPGDSIWVYDVASGLYDLSNEINFRGQTYWPVKLRVLEISYPITKGMGVYFRAPTPSATIYDLTPYFVPEPAGTSQIEVGAFTRSLIPPSSGGIGGVIAPIINPESPPPIPDPPTIFGNERSILVKQPTTSGGLPLPLTVTKFDIYASTTSGFTPGPTNYIGYISVAKADITLNIDVLKSFKWEEPAQTYVRTSAVNTAGPGPASTEVAVTAGLIPSAAILSLVADKIDAGTISASVTIMSPEIYGGIIATAMGTGQRVAMEEGDFDRIKFYTGDVSEDSPGFLYTTTTGAGGTKQIYMAAFGPRFAGLGTGSWTTQSGSTDGTLKAGAAISATSAAGLDAIAQVAAQSHEVRGWIGDYATGRRWVLTPTSAELSYGDATQPSLAMGATSGSLSTAATGRFVAVTPTHAILAYAATGRRIHADSDGVSAFGSDNVEKWKVDDTYIHSFRDVVMHDWLLSLRGVNDNNWLGYSSGFDGPILKGNEVVGVSSATRDTVLQVGTAINEALLMNNASSSYANFFAIINDMSDPELKDVLKTKVPDALADVLQTETFLYRDKGKKKGSPFIGVSALALPDYLTTQSSLELPSGRKAWSIKPSSAIAWVIRAMQQLYREFDERLKKLEEEP